MAAEAIAMGARALLDRLARARTTHSPSHVGLDPVWARAQEAGMPIVFHVGGGGRCSTRSYFDNGLPPVPDFHGGDENFRSIDYMAIPLPGDADAPDADPRRRARPLPAAEVSA